MPLISAGSRGMIDGGSLATSAEDRDGVHGLVGEERPDGTALYDGSLSSGGAYEGMCWLAIVDELDRGQDDDGR